jgi:hypothetical protein
MKPNPETDLCEESMIRAIKAIRESWGDEWDRRNRPMKIIVTEEGIAYVKARMKTDREFRKAVKAEAARNPEYRKLCKDVGVKL